MQQKKLPTLLCVYIFIEHIIFALPDYSMNTFLVMVAMAVAMMLPYHRALYNQLLLDKLYLCILHYRAVTIYNRNFKSKFFFVKPIQDLLFMQSL